MMEAEEFTAITDAADLLVSADPGFAILNQRGGGGIGRALASRELATVARLARRLGIPVQRAVTVADGDLDLECWVRAEPEGEGASLNVTPLRKRAALRPALENGPVPPPAGVDWTWETDAGLRIQRLLVQAGERHGFDATAALGHPLSRLFELESDARGALPLIEAATALEDFERQTATMRDGGAPVTLAGHARRDRGGAFAGFVGGTFHQPTRPNQMSALAGGAFNQRLDRILRGPLAKIVANADSINAALDGPVERHYTEYAADIASAARHLMGLIDDLADIEAIEREDFTVEDEGIDLADVARRAAGLLAVRAADAGVTIDRGDPDQILLAHGEFRRSLQIMVNLISNAVRYSPRGSTVWLRLQRDGDRAIAIVADQGKGIAPDDQERIFGKFERVDPGEPGGSGLGLYIARRLARAMGGDLLVDSAAGQGARFILSLRASGGR